MKAILILAVSIIALNIRAQKGYQCRWQEDQTGKDIPAEWLTTVKKCGVNYCFSNNNSCLFLNMKITETAEQARILKSGLTLWIDTEGKSRKKTGVRFPIGADYSGFGRRAGGGTQQTPLSMANNIQLIGFDINGNARIPSNNTEGLRGNIFYDNDGNLIYNLIIPFDSFTALKETGGNPLTFGIEIGAPPPMPSGPPQGFPQGGGGGMPPSGGRPGGGGGRSMPPAGGGMPSAAQAAPAPLMIWVKDARLSEGK